MSLKLLMTHQNIIPPSPPSSTIILEVTAGSGGGCTIPSGNRVSDGTIEFELDNAVTLSADETKTVTGTAVLTTPASVAASTVTTIVDTVTNWASVTNPFPSVAIPGVFVGLAHKAGSPVTLGTFLITSVPSTKVKAESNGVYSGNLIFTFLMGNSSGFVPGTITGAGSISPTAIKVKADGSLVIRLDDSVTIVFSGTTTGGSPGTVNGDVEVSDAGQSTVKGA